MIAEEKQYQFTEDWFSKMIPVWERLVLPLLPTRERFLEIGCFEGRASCWMLEHALSDSGELVCIDTFEGSPEFKLLPHEHTVNIEERFHHNVCLTKSHQTVTVLRGTSLKGLARLLDDGRLFDLIYVDASHEVTDTLTDAVMAWPLLKNGGVMVFDDYLWNLYGDVQSRPKFAIDTFTTLWNPYIVHLGVGDQYIIKKK